jgi:hypothetical protein
MAQRLCVITAMRNCAPLVPAFKRMIDSFEVQPTRVIIGVNDCNDATEELLRQWNHAGLEIMVFNTGITAFVRERPAQSVSHNDHLIARSAHLATIRNRVIERALEYKDWDVALMQDAAKVSSPDLPGRLMKDGGDIVAPLSWYCQNPAWFYDTWCFVDSNGANFERHLPPELFQYARIAVNAVGGVYAVKRQVFEAGCRLAGTDGRYCDSAPLCADARALGFSVFVRTDLGVTSFDYPNHVPNLPAMNAYLPAGDYASPGFVIIRPDQAFPDMTVEDGDNNGWPNDRGTIPHNCYVDSRSPRTRFLNRDEALLVYNSALQFKGKRALEIGCWLGWSTAHLALAGLLVDAVDPSLAEPMINHAVSHSLNLAGVLSSVNIVAGQRPQKVAELATVKQRKWSMMLIVGHHGAPGPLSDAQICEGVAESDALIIFHNLAVPGVAQGLDYLRNCGWHTLVYQTAQIMGAAWRGNVKPVDHIPDPRVTWPPLPEHLCGYAISG